MAASRCRPDQLVGPERRPRTLTELKSLGLKTFLLPMNPGNGDDGGHDGLRVRRDATGLGRDRGIRPAGHPSHR